MKKRKYLIKNNFIANHNLKNGVDIYKKNNKKRFNLISTNKNIQESENNLPSSQFSQKRYTIYSGQRMNLKSSIKFMETEAETKPKINYSYNICEVIVSSFLGCFMTENLKIKKNITLKANTLLHNKLDIFLYIKNQFLIDYIKLTLLDENNENKESLIDFLSRPIISLKKEEKETNKIHKNFNEDEFDKFYNEIMEMIKRPKSIKNEKEIIISFSNKKLKELI